MWSFRKYILNNTHLPSDHLKSSSNFTLLWKLNLFKGTMARYTKSKFDLHSSEKEYNEIGLGISAAAWEKWNTCIGIGEFYTRTCIIISARAMASWHLIPSLKILSCPTFHCRNSMPGLRLCIFPHWVATLRLCSFTRFLIPHQSPKCTYVQLFFHFLLLSSHLVQILAPLNETQSKQRHIYVDSWTLSIKICRIYTAW
jgi:hypothetical protein